MKTREYSRRQMNKKKREIAFSNKDNIVNSYSIGYSREFCPKEGFSNDLIVSIGNKETSLILMKEMKNIMLKFETYEVTCGKGSVYCKKKKENSVEGCDLSNEIIEKKIKIKVRRYTSELRCSYKEKNKTYSLWKVKGAKYINIGNKLFEDMQEEYLETLFKLIIDEAKEYSIEDDTSKEVFKERIEEAIKTVKKVRLATRRKTRRFLSNKNKKFCDYLEMKKIIVKSEWCFFTGELAMALKIVRVLPYMYSYRLYRGI